MTTKQPSIKQPDIKQISIKQLVNYCDNYLQVDQYNDYCPNGLQVQGKKQIKKIVTGVSATQALIDVAIDNQADVLLVHHGFFWKGENPVLTGMKYHRIKALMKHEINLLAYHLPLDAHNQLGNNRLLAKALKIKKCQSFGNQQLALIGSIKPVSGKELAQKLNKILHRNPLHIDCNKEIKKLAVCTGAAQGYILDAIEQGADAFISGEISENTVHIARENNIHYYAAGHHATERFGVQALGLHLAEKFAIKCQFIDIDNPV
ncbi:MAG: Nif3-like dinuclear metal center hexameric protein [Pseudomonadota bacterium]